MLHYSMNMRGLFDKLCSILYLDPATASWIKVGGMLPTPPPYIQNSPKLDHLSKPILFIFIVSTMVLSCEFSAYEYLRPC